MRMHHLALALGALAACGGGSDPSDPDAMPAADARADAATDPTTAISYTVMAFGGLEPEPDDVVLVRDGDDGPWQRLTGVDGVYRGRVVGPRYAIARACRTVDLGYGEVWLFHLTLDDTTDLHDIGCRPPVVAPALTGILTGVDDSHRAVIATRAFTRTTPTGATDYYTSIAPAPTELVARLIPAGALRPTEKLILERDLAVTGDVVRDLDFDADGFTLDEHAITVAGTGGGDVERVGSALITANGSYIIEGTAGATDRYHALPADQLRPGDLVSASRGTGLGDSFRTVNTISTVPGDITATLPPAYTTPAPTVVITSTAIGLAGTLPPVADADYYVASASQSDVTTGQTTYWVQAYTARWGDGQAIDYQFEDLSSVDGWTVGLTAANPVYWFHSFDRSELTDVLPPGAYGAGRTAVAGDVGSFAQTSGVLTP